MTTGHEGRPDRRGDTPMSMSFDVLVTSLDALNAQVRGLRQDMQRGADMQNRFGNGADEPEGPPPPLRTSGDYNPGAGRTSLSNIRRMSLGQAAAAAARLLLTPPQPPAAPPAGGAPAAPASQGFNFYPPAPLGAFQAPPRATLRPPSPPGAQPPA